MSNTFSSKSHFVQPNVVCPAPAVPAVPAVPTFWTPALRGSTSDLIFLVPMIIKDIKIIGSKQYFEDFKGPNMVIVIETMMHFN
jgi:hypothetical protein